MVRGRPVWLGLSLLALSHCSAEPSPAPAPSPLPMPMSSPVAPLLPLALQQVLPSVWPTAGGIPVSILGSGFVAGSQVVIAGQPALPLTYESATRLRVVLPPRPGVLGDADVQVQNPDGEVALRHGLFAYSASQLRFPSTTYAVGAGPAALASADLDGDQRPDLITADSVSGTVSVLLNRGAAGFVAGQRSLVGVNPSALAVADLNRDGKPDLVVANTGGDDVSVLLGDGRGGLSAPVALSSKSLAKPCAVSTADFDGDGILDLGVVSSGNTQLTLFQGTGAGTFVAQAPQDLPKWSGPQDLVTRDFDGDGKVDVAVIWESGHLGVLLNTGGFLFAARPTINVGSGANALQDGDFDGDGKIDLAVATNKSILVYLGDGSGGFGTSPSVVGAGNMWSQLASADANGNYGSAYVGWGAATCRSLWLTPSRRSVYKGHMIGSSMPLSTEERAMTPLGVDDVVCPHCGDARVFDPDPGKGGAVAGTHQAILRCYGCSGMFVFPLPARQRPHERPYMEPARSLDAGLRLWQYWRRGLLVGKRLLEHTCSDERGSFARLAQLIGIDADSVPTSGVAYDLITSHRVLERSLDPGAELTALRARLAPTGQLLIAVANAHALAYKRRGIDWAYAQAPSVLHHFTSAGLSALLQRHGFAPTHEIFLERWDASGLADGQLGQLFQRLEQGPVTPVQARLALLGRLLAFAGTYVWPNPPEQQRGELLIVARPRLA